MDAVNRGDARRLPAWALRILRWLPPDAADNSQSGQCIYAQIVLHTVGCSPPDSAAVYALFTHSGYYVGKAVALRSGARLGISGRFIEHPHAVFRPGSREGSLPRYKHLRRSVGSS